MTSHFNALRNKAEQKLGKHTEQWSTEDIDDTKRLLHEIDVYHAELEIQNEELRNAQQTLQESNDLLFTLFHLAPIAYLVVNEKGLIVNANSAAKEMVADPDRLLKHCFLASLIHPDERVNFNPRFRRLIENQGVSELELRWMGQDNTTRWVCMAANSISAHQSFLTRTAGDERINLITLKDISAQKRAIDELEKAKLQAEEATRNKSNFLARMSHEIRTPLHAVLGMTQILGLSTLNDRQRKQVNTILHSGNHLLRVINDILDFSKLESDCLSLKAESFSLYTLMDYVFTSFTREAQHKSLRYSLDMDQNIPDLLVGDEDRLAQVLFNLVGNAVKFTDRGAIDIRLSLTQVDRGRALILFDIKDTGIGMPQDYQRQIFTAFSQADATSSRKYGGTGLGLVITRRLVELMGGELHFFSSVHQGSRFYFEVSLPLHQGELEQSGSSLQCRPPVDPASRHTARILLVDDDPVSLDVSLTILLELGFDNVDTALSGSAALALWLSDSHYDLIISDCEMPNLDGYELTRRIRHEERDRNLWPIPIIALSAHVLTENRDRVLDCGMNDILSKPLVISDLGDKLDHWLHRQNRDRAKAVSARPQTAEATAAESDPALRQRLAKLYLQQFPDAIDEIQRAQQSGDREIIRVIAHRMKGSSLYLELNEMSGLFGIMEQDHIDPASVTKQLERIKSRWQQTRQILLALDSTNQEPHAL